MKGRISREAENNFWSYMLSITYSITVLRTCATFFSAVAMTVEHTSKRVSKPERKIITATASLIARNANKESCTADDRIANVQLSEEQVGLRSTILDFAKEAIQNYEKNPGKPQMFVIEGDAGTGKSVILNSLFNEIQRLAKVERESVWNDTKNRLLVNHPEMLKLYHRISQSFPYVSKTDINRPTSHINSQQKSREIFDVVIIDEAHLLASAKNGFKRFMQNNHLEEIMKSCKCCILVFDEKQSLRCDQFWSENDGAQLEHYLKQASKYQIHHLRTQFRMQTSSQEIQDWVRAFSTEKKILPIPKSTDNFEFKVWDNCQAMYEQILKLNDRYGQCRMLSTYDFPYRIGSKDWYVSSTGGFKLRWDRFNPQSKLPWSERLDSIEEVGSVYTIQGFDLNYAGVILGPCVKYDEKTDGVKFDPSVYDDHAGFQKRQNIVNHDLVKEKIIMNSINVLLTRPIRGLYIHIWDPILRQRFSRQWA